MAESETVHNQEENSQEQEVPAWVVEAAPNSELANPDTHARTIKIFCHNCQQKLDVTSLQPFARIACPACGAELIIPQWFDTYLLEEPCGYGGMSSVYRALDIALDREVAIKILNPEIAPESERSALFLNEARTAATINHYSVVPIYTCGIYNGQTYIVMQFMNGGSLEAKLNHAEETLPIQDVVKWIHDVAEGLENACRHGIIHHDIKPGNIMLDADNNAKIGDFGIAQSILASPATPSAKRETWVSPLYVSPEKVATGEENSRGDIYSLGATFYHLLAGKPPFQNENLEELIWCRTKQNPLPPNQVRPEIPLVLTSLIMRMLHRYPDMRPSYQEIISSLDAFLKNPEMGTTTELKRNPLSRSAIYVPSGTAPASSIKSQSPSSIKPKSPSSLLRKTNSSVQQSPPKSVPPNTAPQSRGHLQSPASPPHPQTPQQPAITPSAIQDPAAAWLRNKYLIAFIVLTAVLILFFVVFGLVQLLNAQDPKVLPDMPETQPATPATAPASATPAPATAPVTTSPAAPASKTVPIVPATASPAPTSSAVPATVPASATPAPTAAPPASTATEPTAQTSPSASTAPAAPGSTTVSTVPAPASPAPASSTVPAPTSPAPTSTTVPPSAPPEL